MKTVLEQENEQLKRNFRSLQNELDCVGGDAKILLSHERAASNRLKRAHQQEKMSLTIKLDDVRKELEALKTKYESELTNNASRTANLAVIRSDDDGAELISGLLDKSSGEIWEITPLNNNTYSIMNQSFGLYANCRMRPMKGDVVEAKERRKQWYIKESRSRGKYMISPLEGYFCWSLDDGALDTPVTLADESSSDKNMWIVTFA